MQTNKGEKNIKIGTALIRRSSVNQKGKGSFEIQKRTILSDAKSLGYQIPDEYIFYEDAVSAYTKRVSERQEMRQMKKLILTEDIDAIFFYDLSRMDRTGYSFVEDFYNIVIKENPFLKVYTGTSEWLPDTLVAKVQLLLNYYESMTKSRRRTDNQYNDLTGTTIKRPGSAVPYGYEQIDKKLHVNENEARIVLFIFYMSSWGHSVQKIAKILNESNIPSPLGKKWNPSTVGNMLKNEVYIGNLKWKFRKQKVEKNDIHIEENHQKIVPHMLYKLNESVRNLKNKYIKFDTPFLLSDLLICNCGNHLNHKNSSTRKNNKRYSYLRYFCQHCSYQIDIDELNSRVLKYIDFNLSKMIDINPDYIKNKVEEYVLTLRKHQAALEAKVEVIRANQKLAEINKSEHELLDIYDRVKTRIQVQIDTVKNAIIENEYLLKEDEFDIFLNSFKDVGIQSLANEEKRLVILYFVEKIIISQSDSGDFKIKVNFKHNPINVLTG